MSLYDYRIALELDKQGHSAYALIQAAMLRSKYKIEALEPLRQAFPKLWNELQERSKSPGGFLLSDGEIAKEDKEKTNAVI